MTIELFLRLNVLPNVLLFKANRRHRISARPEFLTVEVALPPAKLPSYRNRALPLHIADDLRDRVFRGNVDHHVDVVLHHVTFDNLALFLDRQLVKHRTQIRPDGCVATLADGG